MTEVSFKERQDHLAARIRAHKKFANFDIADWIDTFLTRRPRLRIFDLGCGDGNHLGLYLKHVPTDGLVAGVDREPSLIARARARYQDATNLDLRVASMDEVFPFGDSTFDTCFSNFAIYNARDALFTMRELHRVLAPGGELVLIGPTTNNARELYEFNERVTGTATDDKTLVRTRRLSTEFVPIAWRLFGTVSEEVLNSLLTFPDRDEFIRYFRATLLYEEIVEKRGVTEEQLRAACPKEHDIPLSKEMLAVIAVKAGT